VAHYRTNPLGATTDVGMPGFEIEIPDLGVRLPHMLAETTFSLAWDGRRHPGFRESLPIPDHAL
jgi:hypothetical protein